jgi:hypothetical protein
VVHLRQSVTDDVNPYAAPLGESARPTDAPGIRLFTLRQILAASFLTSAISGALLIAINESRLGRGSRVPWILALGVAMVALAVASDYVLPQLPALPFALGLAAAMYAVGKQLSGPDLDAHAQRGGQPASNGSAVGWSLLGLGVAVAAIVGVVLVGEGPRAFAIQSEVSIAPQQNVLYYDDAVSHDEAKHLAKSLRDLGVFAEGPADVELDKHDGTYDLCFFVADGVADNADDRNAWRDLLEQTLPQIYPEGDVRAGLCEADGSRKAEVFP